MPGERIYDPRLQPTQIESYMDLLQGKGLVFLGIALAVIAVVLIAKKLLSNKTNKGSTILLLGIPNSGKTVLFEQLRNGMYVETHSSMKQNEDTFELDANKGSGRSKEVHVVDIPGNQRIRPKYLDYVQSTRAIVFVVDSGEFESEVKEVAQFLFQILTNPILNKKRVPMIIFCNKKDLMTSRDQKFVKSQLQKSLDQLRKLKMNAVPDQTQDDAELEDVFLGIEGTPFEFDQLENEVSFVSGSSAKGEIEPVVEFINHLVK